MTVRTESPAPVERLVRLLKLCIPQKIFSTLQPLYHRALAGLGTLLYRNPSRALFVVAVTGTKGKTSTAEFVAALLRAAGFRTALLSTVHFVINGEETPNRFKMTVPGRFFVQKFLREAADKKCTHAVIEMSSEAAKQFRHRGVELDALIFTNLAPEHLEAHGGMEAYAAAKLSLARHLEGSRKRPRYIVANADDAHGAAFLAAKVEKRVPFSLKDAEPFTADERGARFFWQGELWNTPVPGLFNLKNVLAALSLGEAMGLPREAMKRAVENLRTVAGRAERVERGQRFTVIVDYAHTPESLQALYETFGPTPANGRRSDKSLAAKGSAAEEVARPRRICVLGATGGGRDKWKRAELGKIADRFCDEAVVTDEDPYDEDPRAIMDDVAKGFVRLAPRIIEDRRAAIRAAFKEAREGDYVLISGKGTDPYICRARGAKEEWGDAQVAAEELDALQPKKKKEALPEPPRARVHSRRQPPRTNAGRTLQ